MSYQDKANEMGRIPFEFIEVEVDRCNLTFGQGSCPATGEPCYNTWATCKAKPAYDKGSFVYRFTTARSDIPVGFDCVPLMQSITYAPQQLTPGKGLGVRGAVSLRFDDAPWPDQIFDPYFDQRPQYDDGQGSFWGKWLARHKYYLSRSLKVFTGYLVNNQIDLTHFKSRAYILEKITGPDKNGAVTITAKDILKLADDDKAKCPRATSARLDVEINETATTFDVYPAGIGDQEFNSSGTLRISNELMTFTRSGDTFTVVRGASNTVAKKQDIDSTVQQAAIFYQKQVQDIIYSLLVDYAKIPASYINKSEWDAERNANLEGVFSAVITEPVGVNTLLAEITEQGQCYIWWDEVAQKIRFKALVAPDENLPIYDDANQFLAGSLSANIDVNSRQSRFIVYFDLVDPTKKLDESSNYRQRHIGADLQSESDVEYGTSKSKIIYSRWFNSGSLGRVQALAEALLNRYRDPPRLFDFELDAAENLTTGDYLTVSSRLMQKPDGANDVVPMQITETQEAKAGSVVKYKASELIFVEQVTPPAGDIIINGDVFDLNLRSIYEAEFGIPPATGEVTFYIMPTAFVSSSSAYRPSYTQRLFTGKGGQTIIRTIPGTSEIPAMDTGLWPADLIVNLVVAGKQIGRGGDGAVAYPYAYAEVQMPARNGHAGAPALLNQHSKLRITIKDGGVLARGGSGGGSGGGMEGGSMGGGGAPYGNISFIAVKDYDGFESIIIPEQVYVFNSTMATKDVPGVGRIISSSVRSGDGGTWGSIGDDGAPSGTYNASGIAGAGGAAIVGVTPESVVIEAGGQLLETL